MPILGLRPTSEAYPAGPSHPPHFSLEPLIRPNILALIPYRAARDDYSAGVLLDANENAIGPSLPPMPTDGSIDSDAAKALSLMSQSEMASLNRYPSPTHDNLRRAVAQLRNLPNEDWVFLGVGSDEVIDMLYRVLCIPAKDVVMTCPPTYGMYKVTAQVNDIGVLEVPLITQGGKFELDEPAMDTAFQSNPDLKMLFICSPGNPTGTLIPLDSIKRILENPAFRGIVIVDEAYIDFSPEGASAANLVKEYANVCVTQTLSKSFGLAAIRLGYLLASPALIQILTNAKAPYNISVPTASLALSALSPQGLAIMEENTATLIASRTSFLSKLTSIPGIGRILGGNHTNFILAEILDGAGPDAKPSNQRALSIYKTMAETLGVVVRFRGNEIGCEGCLRITIGTEDECAIALQRLEEVLGNST